MLSLTHVGGASGPGAATVHALHAQGRPVTVADRDADAAQLGERALAVEVDLTDDIAHPSLAWRTASS